MTKSGVDQDALIQMFSQASSKQGETLRKAVSDATLKAMQGRELSLANIRKVLKTVTEATTAGAAQSALPAADVEVMLGKAVEGMDAALIQTVEANRRALEQFVGQGVGLQEKQMKSALSDLEKLEDTFFSAVTKAATAAGGTMAGPWQQVLDASRAKGSDAGAQAASAVEQVVAQAQTSLREGRATGLRAAQAMMDSYAAMVSGVLLGMSQGFKPAAAAHEPAEKAARRR